MNRTKNKETAGINLEDTHRIIVIGASTGGLEAFKKIIKELPSDFSPPIFIVWHMSPDASSILPQVLNTVTTICSAHGYDNEEIKANRIYIASPDHHLLIQDGKMRVTRGPKENRFRPAIDPLFRSAAYAYGNRVVGVILSGALDDGTSGLSTVKYYGGVAIVQDPADAEVPSMPKNALREVSVDYCVPASQVGQLLVRLSKEPPPQNTNVIMGVQTKKGLGVTAEDEVFKKDFLRLGELTPFTCPQCHGALSMFQKGNIVRYKCHAGHVYSDDALMLTLTEKVEHGLYDALRGMDETIILLNHLGDHLAAANQPKSAAVYFKKAKELRERSQLVRKTAVEHEQLSRGTLLRAGQNENGAARN